MEQQVRKRPCILISVDRLQFFVDDLCALKSNPLIKGTVSVSFLTALARSPL